MIFSSFFVSSIVSQFIILDSVIYFQNDTSTRSDEDKTIASLKKVDSDYPFYIMKYYGDYGFQDVVENGRYSNYDIMLDEGWGCTCFSAVNPSYDPIFGRNFDWMEEGALFVYTIPSYGYASISMVNLGILGLNYPFNPNQSQVREKLLLSPFYLMDGMNEMGLTVGIMAINRASRTYNASQATISSLDIVRLALEYASTVGEALFLWEKYNIEFGSVPIHYLIADQAGDSAIVEWIDGDMYVYPITEFWQVSTNFIFTDGISYCWRYQRANQLLQDSEGGVNMKDGMEILKDCSQLGLTLWSNIYNLKTRQVIVAINQNYDETYSFQF